MENEYGKCTSCPAQLSCVDDDSNGDRNATCARCRAEESHDFDADPGATFDRLGRRVERSQDQRPFTALISTMAQQPQRQDSTDAQLRDLQVASNRLGLYDAADVVARVLEKKQYVCGACRALHATFVAASACCSADHVECPMSDLPSDAEVGQGKAYNYSFAAFSAGWEIVKNTQESGCAVAVYPLPPLLSKILALLEEDSRLAGEATLKDEIMRLLNKRQ